MNSKFNPLNALNDSGFRLKIQLNIMEREARTDELSSKADEEFLNIPQILGANYQMKLDDKQKVQTLIDLLSKPSPTNKDGEEGKISKLERECGILRAQLELQSEENERAQEEIEHLKNQIVNQSTYCASLGAVLGNLTWRASRFPEMIDVWLSGFQDKIGEFLSIVNGSFAAFINTYGDSLPPTSNAEYQFTISLLGIVTNVSASPEGREFLITNSCGKNFVQQIMKFMPNLPLSQGSLALKRLMFMILYNVSMNKTGLQHLFESQVGCVLNHYLANKSAPEEIQLLCLHVLQSITYDLTNPRYIEDLIASISIEKIKSIASSNRSGTSTVAKKILKHLQESQKYIDLN